MGTRPVSEFEKASASRPGSNIVSEFWYLLRANNKWWLLPLLVFVLLFGGIMLLSTSAIAPFIYTMF